MLATKDKDLPPLLLVTGSSHTGEANESQDTDPSKPENGGAVWSALKAAGLAVAGGAVVPGLVLAPTAALLASVLAERFGRPSSDAVVGEQPPQEFGAWVGVISLVEAVSGDWRFAPGHPFPGHLYKQHPLARRRPEKAHHFIPVDDYDAVLFQEREAELIRLLVVLGANEIEITRKNFRKEELAGSAGASVAGAGGVEVAAGTDARTGRGDVRRFTLAGVPWESGMSPDFSSFGWLDFEPSWDSLRFARITGGCTEATIELTTRTSFSMSAKVGVTDGMLNGLGEVGASLKSKFEQSSDFTVSVRFPGPAQSTENP